jgi:hypothetical protein
MHNAQCTMHNAHNAQRMMHKATKGAVQAEPNPGPGAGAWSLEPGAWSLEPGAIESYSVS